MTYLDEPAMGSILYAKETPAYGGDTLFANMYLAYEALSVGMKRMLEKLRAVHTARDIYGMRGNATINYTANNSSMTMLPSEGAHRETLHPVVRTHPATGRKCLYVNRTFTVRFEDMTEAESRPLPEYLWEHCVRPEFTCRFRWKRDSVAFWDNRCTQHYALNDYQNTVDSNHARLGISKVSECLIPFRYYAITSDNEFLINALIMVPDDVDVSGNHITISDFRKT